MTLVDFKEKEEYEDQIFSFVKYLTMVARRRYVGIPIYNLTAGSEIRKRMSILLSRKSKGQKKNTDECDKWKRSLFSCVTEEYKTIYFLFMYIVHIVQFIVANFKRQIKTDGNKARKVFWKLRFLTPWYKHTSVYIKGLEI